LNDSMAVQSKSAMLPQEEPGSQSAYIDRRHDRSEDWS
jgi:hypothetical protein